MDSVQSVPYRNKSTDNLEVSVKGIWYGVIIVTLIVTAGCAGRRADIVIDPAMGERSRPDHETTRPDYSC